MAVGAVVEANRDDGWGVPVALDEGKAVPAFPLEVLPPALAGYVESVARGLGCPVDYVALPVLVLAGASIGNRREFEIKPGWVESAALYGLVAGPPGSGKTPALHTVLEAARRGDRNEEEKKREPERPVRSVMVPVIGEQGQTIWECPLPEGRETGDEGRETGKDDREAKRGKWELPFRVCTDLRLERVQEAAAGGRSVVVVADDLNGWPGTFPPRAGDLEARFYQAAWAGAGAVRRAAFGDSSGGLLAIIGCVTIDCESPAGRRWGPGERMLERWLIAYPEWGAAAPWEWSGVEDGAARPWARTLEELTALETGGSAARSGGTACEQKRRVTLSACGRKEWEGLAAELAGEAKLRASAARLSLIVQMIRWAHGEAGDHEVDGESVRRAGMLAGYFREHARRWRAAGSGNRKETQVRRLLRWLEREGVRRFTKRDAYHALRRTFATTEELDEPLEKLVRHGFIRLESKGPEERLGRRASPGYEVNPGRKDEG